MITMNVVEIFRSIQGEGEKVGLPCVFVRLYGCPVHCKFCDTKESWANDKKFETLSIDEIVSRVREAAKGKTKYVVITGGEPFLQARELRILISELVGKDLNVMIETSGSVDSPEALETLSYICDDSIVFATHVCINLSPKNEAVHEDYINAAHEIKILIGASEADDPKLSGDLWLRFSRECGKSIANASTWHPVCSMFVQPIAYQDKVKTLMAIQRAVEAAEKLGCRVSFQTHKFAGLR